MSKCQKTHILNAREYISRKCFWSILFIGDIVGIVVINDLEYHILEKVNSKNNFLNNWFVQTDVLKVISCNTDNFLCYKKQVYVAMHLRSLSVATVNWDSLILKDKYYILLSCV